MMTYADLKAAAKEKLRGNWGWGALTIFLFFMASHIAAVISLILLIPVSIPIALIFCTNNGDSYIIAYIIALVVFCCFITYTQLFLLTGIQAATYDLVNDKKTENVFQATFSQFINHRGWRFFTTYFLTTILNILWFLLFFIPGCIKGLAYSQSLYIIQDAVDNGIPMTSREAITLSRKVMNGHKCELFGLMLSFLGWLLLSIITYGIGFFWTIPYMLTTMAEYHKYVMDDYIQRHQAKLTSSKAHMTASFSV